MARPKKLKYVGRMESVFDERGREVEQRPTEFHNGVPARDLKEEDLAALSDDDIKLILGGTHPLYVDPEVEKEKKERDKAKAERDRAKTAKQNADNVRARDRKAAEQTPPPANQPTPEPSPAPPEQQSADESRAEGASGDAG